MRRLDTFSMLYGDPRQTFGNTSPLFSRYTSRQNREDVHLKNNKEAQPKSCPSLSHLIIPRISLVILESGLVATSCSCPLKFLFFCYKVKRIAELQFAIR